MCNRVPAPCRGKVTIGAGTRKVFKNYLRGSSQGISKMSKTIAIATALLLGTASLAVAQTTNKSGTTSPGASQYSPGQEMQDSTTTTAPGASANSPGSRMHEKGTVGQAKGASEMAPGDRMNDKRKH
jgi:hypothetical protein